MPSDSAVAERPLRLLFAERYGWFARTLATVLDTAGWKIIRAITGASVVDLVGRLSPDVIVLRDDLQDTDLVDLCGVLRAHRQVGLITPIVIVAAEVSRVDHLAALRAGAWDYVVQPVDAEAFLIRLTNLARARRDVDRLASAALIDEETGLYNRSGLARRAEEVEAETRRRHAPVSCVVFAPEPNGGENGGPSVTAQIGSILRRRGRGSDVIGRLDDVLAVIAPSTGADGAARLAERLRGIIRELPAEPHGGGRPLPVRAAYCTAQDFARSTLSLSEMLQRAREALRRAPPDIDGPLSVPGDLVPLAPPG
jgi:two-component system alkaline phosphatase synthesis response regulator PhoP